MVHSLALAPVLAVVPPKLHSHVHVHVVFHPLPLEVLVQVDRSFGIVMVVGIAYYSVLSHQLSLVKRKKGGRSGRTMRSMLRSHIWIVKLWWGSSLALAWVVDIWVMIHVMLWVVVHSWSRTGSSVWYRSMWRTSIWTEHEWWS